MPTTFLNLTDLDNRIRAFEQRFGVSSVEMLQDASVRASISEDTLLKWEAYVRQRVYLRDVNVDCHSSYLDQVHPGDPAESRQESDELAFAA